MAEKKISQLTNATTPLTGTEVVPLVQGGVTKKVAVSEFGGSTAWGDITGTLSAQTDLNSALTAKQDTLVSGTNLKTINSTSLLGSGNIAVQDTLVSGTNIKTINGNSLLGSGDLTISGGGGLTIGTTAITSGTIGRVLFQGTGNVLQQSTNLFWDNTNSRLGIGTSSPNMALDIRTGNVGIGVTSDAGFKLDVNGTARVSGTFTSTTGLKINQFNIQPLNATNQILGFNTFYNGSSFVYDSTGTAGYIQYFQNKFTFNSAISGTGGSSLSSPTTLATLDNNTLTINGSLSVLNGNHIFNNSNITLRFGTAVGTVSSNLKIEYMSGGFAHWIVPVMENVNSDNNNISFYLNNSTTSVGSSAPGTGNALAFRVGALTNTSYKALLIEETTTLNTTPNASSILNLNSTTKGFLPPRMTTTQKNAIASPAAGLIVYDTTLNKLCVRTASTWETITSI